jgi:hypothetical protein
MACFDFPVQLPTNHVRFTPTILAESFVEEAREEKGFILGAAHPRILGN